MKKILPCHIHDYVEISCLYGFEIELAFNNRETIQGKAMTTEVTPDKSELLLLLVEGMTVKVELTDILTMTAINKNPHFDVIEFQG